MISRFIILSMGAVALAACGRGGPATSTEVGLDEPVQLAPGQSAAFPAQKLEVRFTGIASDSRCPTDVTCVWAGEVVVQLAVDIDGTASKHEIKEAQSEAVGGHTLTVLQVLPAPTTAQRIAPADYRVTLKIAR